MIRDRVSEVVGAVASCSSVRRFGSSPRLLLFQAGLLAAAACGSGALWAISDGRVSAVELIPAILLPGAVAATLAYKSSCSRLAGILADLMTTALISVAVRVTGGAASEAYVLYFVSLVAQPISADGARRCWATLMAAGAYTIASAPWHAPDGGSTVWLTAFRAGVLLVAGLVTCALSRRLLESDAAASAARAKLRMRERWDEAMLRISRGVDAGLGLSETLELILDNGLQVLEADIGMVALRDRRGKFVIRAVRNASPAMVGRVVGEREGAMGLCLELGQTVRISDYQDYQHPMPEMKDEQLTNVIAAPLFAGTELVGTIGFGDRGKHRSFHQEEVEFIESLAKQLSVVVVNANLLEEARRNADYLSSLNQISMSLTSVLEPYELFEQIYRSVCQVLPLDAFFVAVPSDVEGEAEICFLMDRGVRSPSVHVKLGDTPTAKVMRSGRPLLANVEKPEDSEGFGTLAGADDSETTRSIMIVPMRVGNRVVGAISAQSYTLYVYDEEELELLMTVASSAAIALENARLYESVREQSITDALTGLGNYRYFMDVLTREIERARRYSTPLSLIMVDSDSMKTINDTYGHAAGDKHMQCLTQVMTSVTRRTDYVARYAGDEFMIILPNTSGEAAMVLAERLRTAVEESRFCIDGHEVAATVSIGVASFPESGTDVDSMLKAVDQAMYRSKRAGKNRVSKAW